MGHRCRAERVPGLWVNHGRWWRNARLPLPKGSAHAVQYSIAAFTVNGGALRAATWVASILPLRTLGAVDGQSGTCIWLGPHSWTCGQNSVDAQCLRRRRVPFEASTSLRPEAAPPLPRFRFTPFRQSQSRRRAPLDGDADAVRVAQHQGAPLPRQCTNVPSLCSSPPAHPPSGRGRAHRGAPEKGRSAPPCRPTRWRPGAAAIPAGGRPTCHRKRCLSCRWHPGRARSRPGAGGGSSPPSGAVPPPVSVAGRRR